MSRAAACAVFAALGGCTTGIVARDTPPFPAGATHVYVAADIADCRFQSPARSAAAMTATLVPDGAPILAPGDLAYHRADAATLRECFEPTWGRHRGQMLVALGNHDIVAGSDTAVRDFFPQAARAASDGFFAYAMQPAAGWWLVVVDSNVAGEVMRRQQAWLERTLDGIRGDAATASCLAVMWHAPLYSSGLHKGSGEHMRPSWELIDRYHADLVLSGHEHFYERFDPLDAEGRAASNGDGPRQFVVGTGGAILYGFWRPPYRSTSRVLEHGVLQLALAEGEYAWRFVDVEGRVRDAGAATCRAGMKSGNVPGTGAARPPTG